MIAKKNMALIAPCTHYTQQNPSVSALENMAAVEKRIGKILAESSALFLCDMQDRFSTIVKYFPHIVDVSNRMLTAAKILDVPAIVTEHTNPGDDGLPSSALRKFLICDGVFASLNLYNTDTIFRADFY